MEKLDTTLNEDLGNLPKGYTEDDVVDAFFAEKENAIHNAIPSQDDEPYIADDEKIALLYKGDDNYIGFLLDEQFEAADKEDCYECTVGQARNFIELNELDVDDFKIYDEKGEEYVDALSLLYDAKEETFNSEFDNIDSFGEFLEARNKKRSNKLNEALIAGANGLQYCDSDNSKKHDAADALLKKLGMTPDNVQD